MDLVALISSCFKHNKNEQGIRNLNLFLNLFALYYQTVRNGGG